MKTSLKFLFAVTVFIALLLACKKNSSQVTQNGTCSDGIMNQDETAVDCGGSCAPCPTCSDGIQNQGETDIDCGGPCQKCEIFYAGTASYGPNFLREDTITVFSAGTPPNGTGKYYSMAARLPVGTSLKVVMRYASPAGIYVPYGWSITSSSSKGWIVSNYDQSSNTQQFTATGRNSCDLQLSFLSHGTGAIDFYENGSAIPTRTKALRW